MGRTDRWTVLGALVMAVAMNGCEQASPPPGPAPARIAQLRGSAAPTGMARAPVARGPHVEIATIDRTVCYGTCPEYTARIYRDGTVEWTGKQYVQRAGSATAQLDPSAIVKLDAVFAATAFTSLNGDYAKECSTDSPTVTTSYTPLGGPRHETVHYHGTCDAPPQLEVVEELVDQIAGTQRWIGDRGLSRP